VTKNVIDLEGAIDDLHAQPRDALISRFRDLYRSEPPKQISRDLLLRALCFRLQQKAYGGPNTSLQRRLRSMAEELQQTGAIAVNRTSSLSGTVKPGTRLIREWQGAVHEVTVGDDGYVYRDQCYRSLSQIARAITGTRWSGPAFFGLNGAGAGKVAGHDAPATGS
jgi:hypothetical protein